MYQTCTILAVFGDDVNPSQPGYQARDGTLPWGNSSVTCGGKVYATSRPGLPPLSLPAGCSLFGESLGVGAAGDWWATIGYAGSASLGVNCRGVIDKSTFVIEIVGSGGPKPYGGYGATILVPPALSGESPMAAASPSLAAFSLLAPLLLVLMVMQLGRVRLDRRKVEGWMAEAAARLSAGLKPFGGWRHLVYRMLGLL